MRLTLSIFSPMAFSLARKANHYLVPIARQPVLGALFIKTISTHQRISNSSANVNLIKPGVPENVEIAKLDNKILEIKEVMQKLLRERRKILKKLESKNRSEQIDSKEDYIKTRLPSLEQYRLGLSNKKLLKNEKELIKSYHLFCSVSWEEDKGKKESGNPALMV